MATEAIYRYMQNENRPYSVNDIVANLGNEYPKSVAQKSLDTLVSGGKIFEKVYGKQKIYCVAQDPSQDIDELKRINRELECHAAEVEARRVEVEKLIRDEERRLSKLRETPSLADALKLRDELKREVVQLSERLDGLMEASGGTEDLGNEKRKAEESTRDLSREYAKRKRLCNEIIDCILEGYPGSKKELHEEIGIEIKLVQ